MVAKAGSHLLAATAFAVLAGAGFGADSAFAQGAACLTAPNGAAPAGTHWYYKTDQATHQKCWYTRPQDQTVAAAPAQVEPSRPAPPPSAAERGDAPNAGSDTAEVPEQSAAPIALAPAAAPRVPARVAPAAHAVPRRIAAPIARIPMPAADPRGERQQPIAVAAAVAPGPPPVQAVPDNVRWPDPPTLPQTAGTAGAPFPPPPDVSSAVDPSTPPPATQTQTTDGPSPATATPPNSTAPLETAQKPDADAPAGNAESSAAKPPGRVSTLLVLGGLILLLVAGMLLRGLVEHALSRRRVIKLARQEPRLMEPAAVPPPMPTLLRQAPSVVPGHVQAGQRADEVEAELRRFAESLRQRPPAANGAANGAIGRNGAALRS